MEKAASSLIHAIKDPCTMVIIASTAAGISSGRAEPSHHGAVISCTAASMSKGRLSISAPTMVSTASTAAGMSSGKDPEGFQAPV